MHLSMGNIPRTNPLWKLTLPLLAAIKCYQLSDSAQLGVESCEPHHPPCWSADWLDLGQILCRQTQLLRPMSAWVLPCPEDSFEPDFCHLWFFLHCLHFCFPGDSQALKKWSAIQIPHLWLSTPQTLILCTLTSYMFLHYPPFSAQRSFSHVWELH